MGNPVLVDSTITTRGCPQAADTERTGATPSEEVPARSVGLLRGGRGWICSRQQIEQRVA